VAIRSYGCYVWKGHPHDLRAVHILFPAHSKNVWLSDFISDMGDVLL